MADQPDQPDQRVSVIEDRGSFSYGVCRVCGWSGPGRRSRRVATVDAQGHLSECPAGARMQEYPDPPV
jgi:hypothetical protein